MTETTILVVDDEPVVVKTLSTILRREGFTIVTAANAEEALIVAGPQPHLQLAILDAGLVQTKATRFDHLLRIKVPHIRLLYTSGSDPVELVRWGIDLGSEAFLKKPFTPNQLIQKINGILDPRSSSANA